MPENYGRLTTLNSLVALAKRPINAGLPMFDVIAAETVWTPTDPNVTVKAPSPTMLPKLTRNVFGKNLALGSVELKLTV